MICCRIPLCQPPPVTGANAELVPETTPATATPAQLNLPCKPVARAMPWVAVLAFIPRAASCIVPAKPLAPFSAFILRRVRFEALNELVGHLDQLFHFYLTAYGATYPCMLLLSDLADNDATNTKRAYKML